MSVTSEHTYIHILRTHNQATKKNNFYLTLKKIIFEKKTDQMFLVVFSLNFKNVPHTFVVSWRSVLSDNHSQLMMSLSYTVVHFFRLDKTWDITFTFIFSQKSVLYLCATKIKVPKTQLTLFHVQIRQYARCMKYKLCLKEI